MGSRSKIDLAYIAGFLDGDGSLMLQIKKRKDGKLKYRFMATICFYQDSRHEKPLYWIRKKLGIGYISKRSDGITELRINGFRQVFDILKLILPFSRFKRKQARALFDATKILSNQKDINLRVIARKIIIIQNNNYKSRKKRTSKEVLKILGLTP